MDKSLDLQELGERIEELESANVNSDRKSSRHRPLAIANPSPLGLFGFFIVTWLSGVLKIVGPSAKSEFLPTAGIFIGGVAQFIAGCIQYTKNNTHSATTFSLYGLHWIGSGIRLLNHTPPVGGNIDIDVGAVVYYTLFIFATIVIWIPTLLMNLALCMTLFLVVILFVMDAVYEGTRSRIAEIMAGVFSCLAATGALYLVSADLINEGWGKVIIPIFPHKTHREDYHGRRGKYFPRVHFHKSSTAAAHV